ncbi:hypothetical protein AAC387_Pa02g2605 [Persea americana]
MLDASQSPMYPGCSPDNTLLDFVIKMMEQKVEGKWINKSFNNVMQIQKALLPVDNLVPYSIYAAKKILRDLGLGYEHIDACHNDYALFWKENIDLEKCPVCRESRYKLNDGKGKKIPHKVLRYFPLISRLQRLYMSRKTAIHMRWHSDKRKDDGIGRHPADCEEWSHVKELENKIVLILCKLERIFPLVFFDVMVHLAVHLPREAMLARPVQYRWMYPIER